MKNNKDYSKNRKIAPEAFRDWFIGKLMGYYSKENQPLKLLKKYDIEDINYYNEKKYVIGVKIKNKDEEITFKKIIPRNIDELCKKLDKNEYLYSLEFEYYNDKMKLAGTIHLDTFNAIVRELSEDKKIIEILEKYKKDIKL